MGWCRCTVLSGGQNVTYGYGARSSARLHATRALRGRLICDQRCKQACIQFTENHETYEV